MSQTNSSRHQQHNTAQHNVTLTKRYNVIGYPVLHVGLLCGRFAVVSSLLQSASCDEVHFRGNIFALKHSEVCSSSDCTSAEKVRCCQHRCWSSLVTVVRLLLVLLLLLLLLWCVGIRSHFGASVASLDSVRGFFFMEASPSEWADPMVPAPRTPPRTADAATEDVTIWVDGEWYFFRRSLVQRARGEVCVEGGQKDKEAKLWKDVGKSWKA